MTSRLIYPKLVVEQNLWRTGLRTVAGVDEVGMGPLAGPVVAAAVVFPPRLSEERLPESFPPACAIPRP